MLKRALDLSLSGLGLSLLSPLFALIALAIKLDSPGPVFYRQERVGRHRQPFRIHKFRSMTHAPAIAGPELTVGDDERITRVGALLRTTKLDELPQLIDVLQGSMSLVGPRPEVPRYVALYPPELRDKVLSVRPGITDPASIEFRHEQALLAKAGDPELEYVNHILPRKLELAAEYVDNASLTTDLAVIARTLRAIFGERRRA